MGGAHSIRVNQNFICRLWGVYHNSKHIKELDFQRRVNVGIASVQG